MAMAVDLDVRHQFKVYFQRFVLTHADAVSVNIFTLPMMYVATRVDAVTTTDGETLELNKGRVTCYKFIKQVDNEGILSVTTGRLNTNEDTGA